MNCLKYRISIFVIILSFMLFYPLLKASAQEDSTTSIDKLKTNLLGGAGSSVEVQKYYRFLSDTQKRELLESLSSEEKVRIFENLSEFDRQNLFKILSNTEKRNLFKGLSDIDKRKIFNSLNDSDQRNLFAILDDVDKKMILSNLSDQEKSRLINSLSEDEQAKWVEEYPDLEVSTTTQETPSNGFSQTSMEEDPSVSNIERLLSGQFPSDISRELRQFGYDYFSRTSASYFPETIIPVGPGYIIGPEDTFTIHLWGRTEETYNVTVRRDGSITIPRLGTLSVNGLTFSDLKTYLFNRFNEYYPDFQMSITMGALRTVEVFVIGELDHPGTYSLSSLSTAISAIFASGGPNKNGTLRDIRVFQDGKLIKSIDLYEFFIKGTKESDVFLKQGSTIFIPIIGPVVGIAGCVKRPAIYEMKGTQSIGEIIELAGGVLPIGHLQNVVIERVMGNQTRVVNSFNLDPSNDQANDFLNMPLQDGDVIKIYPVYKRINKVVYLEGHVKYPREYELKEGMRLMDIIPSYDSLLPEPFLPQAEITRLIPPDLHPEVIEFNLGALLEGDRDQNLLLQDQDRVTIYSAWEKREIPEITIKGSVRNPGIYRLFKGMTVKDLLFQAGNLTQNAYLEKADLTRIVPGKEGADLIKLEFSPKNALAGLPTDNLELQRNDLIHIREIPKYGQSLNRKVILEGEFFFPGEYAFSEGERLLSVVQRAGGLTREAYPYGAVFLRESVKEIQKERLLEYISKLEQEILTVSALSAETALDASQASIVQQTLSSKQELIKKLKEAEPTGRMVININEILIDPSSDSNLELRPGDYLIVNKRPDFVNILGEVYNPTSLLVEKEKRVGYYLGLVGGITDNADKNQIYIVKANGSVISKKQEGFLGLASWDDEEHRWDFGGFNSIKLDPGDTIIVPRKIVRFAWLRLTQNISEVLYQIAITAGVLHTTLGLL
ncbi:MAG: SLBB domain-containing protein [Deltaproteobacteria bacterium]|nr:SLBB domain-containing protein [Deltaproteobacteria bacterium]